jgi:hypothetical protein
MGFWRLPDDFDPFFNYGFVAREFMELYFAMLRLSLFAVLEVTLMNHNYCEMKEL